MSRKPAPRDKACIDCGAMILRVSTRCNSCAGKKFAKTPSGKDAPNYKDGASLRQHYCLDCKKEISWRAKRCSSCAKRHIHIPCSESKKKSISKANKGKVRSERTCILLAEIAGNRKVSDETKAKMRKKMLGSNNPQWRGGISYEEYGAEFDSQLKEQVRFRNGYKCRECGCTQLENGKQLCVHHIDYNKKNNVPTNLVALCVSCHGRTVHDRKQWFKHFKDLMEVER